MPTSQAGVPQHRIRPLVCCPGPLCCCSGARTVCAARPCRVRRASLTARFARSASWRPGVRDPPCRHRRVLAAPPPRPQPGSLLRLAGCWGRWAGRSSGRAYRHQLPHGPGAHAVAAGPAWSRTRGRPWAVGALQRERPSSGTRQKTLSARVPTAGALAGYSRGPGVREPWRECPPPPTLAPHGPPRGPSASSRRAPALRPPWTPCSPRHPYPTAFGPGPYCLTRARCALPPLSAAAQRRFCCVLPPGTKLFPLPP
jgi:hypothetical protein